MLISCLSCWQATAAVATNHQGTLVLAHSNKDTILLLLLLLVPAGVFAAGDCCTVDAACTAPHWFQMRLWSQARLMGCAAAAAMAGSLETELQPFSFELVSIRLCGWLQQQLGCIHVFKQRSCSSTA
jgi:hypothetical protein